MYQSMSQNMQYGGGSCSLCGSPGVTKTTCPKNPDAKNPNPSAHPLASVTTQIKKTPIKQQIEKTPIKQLTKLTPKENKITDNGLKLPKKLPFPDHREAQKEIEKYRWDENGHQVKGWKKEYYQLTNYEPWKTYIPMLIAEIATDKDFIEMTGHAMRDYKVSAEEAQILVAESGLDYFAKEWQSVLDSI